jgi:hypothetical protein
MKNEAVSGPNTERKSSIWWSRIISALLGITVTVVGALIVQRLQTREPTHVLLCGNGPVQWAE